MQRSDPLTYQQLQLDKDARVPRKWSTEAPFESLLVFLEGAGLRNQNSGLTLSELLGRPPSEQIVIPFGGQEYRVAKITYPLNQQFARFHVLGPEATDGAEES